MFGAQRRTERLAAEIARLRQWELGPTVLRRTKRGVDLRLSGTAPRQNGSDGRLRSTSSWGCRARQRPRVGRRGGIDRRDRGNWGRGPRRQVAQSIGKEPARVGDLVRPSPPTLTHIAIESSDQFLPGPRGEVQMARGECVAQLADDMLSRPRPKSDGVGGKPTCELLHMQLSGRAVSAQSAPAAGFRRFLLEGSALRSAWWGETNRNRPRIPNGTG